MDSKNKAMPTNQGLQRFAAGLERKNETPVFDSLAIVDDSKGHDAKTGVPIPSAMAIDAAKEWVEEGSKL